MGFFSRIKNKARAQVAPVMPMAPQPMPRPSVMPRRGGSFLSKIRDQAFDKIESGKIPARSGFLRGQYFGPRGNMGSDFRMPQKRSGFGFGLGEAIRRLKEQRGGDMGMPRMPQPIPERMPTDPSSYYNPTIFGQPIGDMDFSQMPKISPEDMSNLQMPTPPQEISQMNLSQMPEGLPSMQDVRGSRSLNFADYKPNKRQRMAAGDEASFPDLTGDGKVTQADILKGRGVYAEGDEVMMMQETDMMAPGNQEIEASLMEVQGMQPDMQVLDQYVQMVTQMIQAGASEAEVIESLRQAGLDDDDIAAVFQAVMETMQGSMEQGGIDSELEQLG